MEKIKEGKKREERKLRMGRIKQALNNLAKVNLIYQSSSCNKCKWT